MRNRLTRLTASVIVAGVAFIGFPTPAHGESPPPSLTVRVLLPAMVADPDGNISESPFAGRVYVTSSTAGRLRLEFLPCAAKCAPKVKWRTVEDTAHSAGFNVPSGTRKFRITRFDNGQQVTAVTGWYPF